MNADQFKTIGNQLLQAGTYEPAIQQYSKGLELEPENFKILSNRAAAYIYLEDFENAAADAKKVIEISPEFAKGYLRLAMAEKGLEQFEDSIVNFNKYLDMLNHDDPSRKDIEEKILKMEEEIEEIQKQKEEEERQRLEEEKQQREKELAEAASKKEKLRDSEEEVTDKTTTKNKELELGNKENNLAGESTDNSAMSLEEPVIEDDDDSGPPCCSAEWWESVMHVGNVANLIGFVILIIGFILKALKLAPYDQYVYNCGMFAFSGGATNWIAITMLFDKVPGLYGSGVIPSRFVEIRIAVKKMVMKNFFDETYLNYYLKKKVMGMDIQKMLDDLIQKHNVTEMIVEMAIADPSLAKTAKDLLKPYIQKMASKIAPLITKAIEEVDFASGMDVARVELEEMLDAKLLTLTPNKVKKMLEDIIRVHLYWLVVWGVVFGGLLGIISAALQLP